MSDTNVKQVSDTNVCEVSDTSVKSVSNPVENADQSSAQTPISALKIERCDSLKVGGGRTIRFRLSEPDPLTGRKSRYYRWIPETQYERFKHQFNLQEIINAERIAEAIRSRLAG